MGETQLVHAVHVRVQLNVDLIHLFPKNFNELG